jgi:hypothetical protein
VIAAYLGKSASSSMYGAAGSLLVVLVWVYYSAQIFLFGAEFTKVYTRRYGSLRRVEHPPAAPGPGMSGAPGPVAGAVTSARIPGKPPLANAAGAPGSARAAPSAPASRLDSRRTIGEARTHSDESDR